MVRGAQLGCYPSTLFRTRGGEGDGFLEGYGLLLIFFYRGGITSYVYGGGMALITGVRRGDILSLGIWVWMKIGGLLKRGRGFKGRHAHEDCSHVDRILRLPGLVRVRASSCG